MPSGGGSREEISCRFRFCNKNTLNSSNQRGNKRKNENYTNSNMRDTSPKAMRHSLIPA